MKDYSEYLTEKPFSCDVDGCPMKFTNADHLTVHKKRHDMTLSFSSGPKGNTFADQTPTPTQFFRNCEEVGLFQDLQNVNPFEETFKKAVEAVRSGQPISLNKSLNTSDDSLHTPNVFPHITDVPNINPPESCLRSENIPTCEDGLLKQDITEPGKICTVDVQPESNVETPRKQTENPVETVGSGADLSDEKVVLNVPEGHLVQLITPDIPQSSCNMVVIKSVVDDLYPLTVKEKLKKSLSEKKTGKCVQQKIPILKWPPKRNSNSLTQKFSKFSKNALKLISKLENAEASEGVENSSRRPRRSERYQSKESRSEFLARSRAASFRCREKKKLYVLYLEKKNSELTAAYQNLQFINSLLRKEVCELHNELLKHKNCSAADKATEVTLSVVESLIGDKTFLEEEREVHTASQQEPNETPTHPEPDTLTPYPIDSSPDLYPSIIDPFSFDVAEVTLDDDAEDNEIPLNEAQKPPDIIVRFNSVGNDIPGKFPPDSHIDRYVEGAGENVKQIFSEHSYYFKQPVDMYKRMVNTLVPPITTEECKKIEELRLKKSDAFRDITSLNTKVLLEPRTPPPLILLKPFKKRSLQNKQSEKT